MENNNSKFKVVVTEKVTKERYFTNSELLLAKRKIFKEKICDIVDDATSIEEAFWTITNENTEKITEEEITEALFNMLFEEIEVYTDELYETNSAISDFYITLD